MYLQASYSLSDVKIIFYTSSIFQIMYLTNQKCFLFL